MRTQTLQFNIELDEVVEKLRGQYKQLYESYNLWPKTGYTVSTESLAITYSLEALLLRALKIFSEWKKANEEVYQIWVETEENASGNVSLLTFSRHFRNLQYEFWDFVIRSKTALDFTSKVLYKLFKDEIPESMGDIIRKLNKGIDTDCPYYSYIKKSFANLQNYNILTYTIDFRDFLIHKGVFIYDPGIDVCDKEHFELNKHNDHTKNSAIPPRLVISGDKMSKTGLPLHIPKAVFKTPLRADSGICRFQYERPLASYVSETFSTILDLYDRAYQIASESETKSFYWRGSS